MSGLIDSASSILLSSERGIEAAANNIANQNTPGFKKEISFTEALTRADDTRDIAAQLRLMTDFSQGQLTYTGNNLDLAVFGPGLLQLRTGDDLAFSRGGTFRLIDGGLLADASGRILQQAGGGDLVTGGGELEVLDDGTVLEDGLPIGTLALVEATDLARAASLGGSVYTLPADAVREAEASQLRPGFLEQANVALADEMVTMMASIRQAEGGARLVQVYNQLLGQAAQTFNRSGR